MSFEGRPGFSALPTSPIHDTSICPETHGEGHKTLELQGIHEAISDNVLRNLSKRNI